MSRSAICRIVDKCASVHAGQPQINTHRRQGHPFARGRRSLNQSQRALIAAGFLAYEKTQAKSRQGARTDMVETFPQGDEGKAHDKAGERMHVSGLMG